MKILVVDDHPIVREGLKALLEIEEDVEEVYEAGSGEECLGIIDKKAPNVVILDLKMPGIGGIETARLIKEMHPEIKVLLLTNYDDEEYVVQSIKAKVDGYVLKDVKKDELPRIIKIVLDGNAFIDSSVTHKVFRHVEDAVDSESSTARPLLTHRELQILACVVEGKSNKEIAQSLYLSLDTVKTHLKNVYQKLGVCKRSQAVNYAIKNGLIHISN
jgi:DNA-binding NarL/FixJ family response regulator